MEDKIHDDVAGIEIKKVGERVEGTFRKKDSKNGNHQVLGHYLGYEIESCDRKDKEHESIGNEEVCNKGIKADNGGEEFGLDFRDIGHAFSFS